MEIFLILKMLGDNLTPPVFFFKDVSGKEIVNSWFLVTFSIIISHIIPESFTEIHQVVQKIWRLSLTKLASFINFSQFFGFFDICLSETNDVSL